MSFRPVVSPSSTPAPATVLDKPYEMAAPRPARGARAGAMKRGHHMIGRTAMIHDIRRDWRHWTMAERVLATLIVSILLISISATILMSA